MINYSALERSSLLGRVLRFPLKLIPKHCPMPIIQGPLQGKRWIAGASTHGCWLGSYELPKQGAFCAFVRSGMVVYDVGANVGFYSLLASQLVGTEGAVIAFEPLAENVRFLKLHLQINSINNVTICEKAVSEDQAVAHFDPRNDRSTGRLDQNGSIAVQCISLDHFVFTLGHKTPNVVKIDVEGAELHVLKGARRVLETFKPRVFLATHGAEVHKHCCSFLQQVGYTLEPLEPGRQITDCKELIAC